MKKTIIVLLLFTVLYTTACVKNTSDFDTNGKGLITGYTGRNTVIVIPSKIGFETIKAILDFAFWVHWRNKLTSVTIPDSVISIGAGAFMENKLTNVIIPNRVKIIEACAFADNELTNVTIPNSVITIGDCAFMDNKLESVTIGNGITSITDYTFYHNQITSITICENVELSDKSFGNGFENAYNNNGKKEGTYTRMNANSEEWTLTKLGAFWVSGTGALLEG